MLQHIICQSGSGSGEDCLVLTVRSRYTGNDLISRIKAAVAEFVRTPSQERDDALSATNGSFGWDDLLWLPERLEQAYGFEVMETEMQLPELIRDNKESLLPDGFRWEG